jgi:hypothetical protein
MSDLALDLQFRLSPFVVGCRPFSPSRGPSAAHGFAARRRTTEVARYVLHVLDASCPSSGSLGPRAVVRSQLISHGIAPGTAPGLAPYRRPDIVASLQHLCRPVLALFAVRREARWEARQLPRFSMAAVSIRSPTALSMARQYSKAR